MSNRSWRALCCLALAGCVTRAETAGRLCPCAAGWTCCADNDVCVPEGDPCPGEVVLGDDELLISGLVCTSTPDEVSYPVKILMLIDTSGSMMFTDPSSAPDCLARCQLFGLDASECASLCNAPASPTRQVAAKALHDHFQSNIAVSYAIVRFNSMVTVNGASIISNPGSFTTDLAVLNQALAGLAQAEALTDYDGALQAAHRLLADDMAATSAVERARTKYVVMLLSDGGPDIQCKEGCGNDAHPTIPAIESWCDVPRDQWCDTYNVSSGLCSSMTSWFPFLEVCKEYNTEQRILDHVSAIAGLKDQYGAGGIAFNTTLLSVPTLAKAIQEMFAVSVSSDEACKADIDCPAQGERCILDPNKQQKLCKAPAESLLIEMAKRGKGKFHRFSDSSQIDFLLFDYVSLFKPFGMTSLIATNRNVRPEAGQWQPDSDGDGLVDGLELAEKLDPLSPDSDGDGYGDRLERALKAQGHDPLQASLPQEACPSIDRVDIDGDGLNACEERALGTDPWVMDTDRDRIPDGLEHSWGTDPLAVDDKGDGDFDGALSGDEIAAHTDPTVSDASLKGYSYTVRQKPSAGPNTCFDFSVRGVALQATQGAGENLVLVYFGEAPSDIPQDYGNFKVACVRGRLGADGTRAPQGGKVSLQTSDFVAPKTLLSRLAAIGGPLCLSKPSDPSCADPCQGAPVP